MSTDELIAKFKEAQHKKATAVLAGLDAKKAEVQADEELEVLEYTLKVLSLPTGTTSSAGNHETENFIDQFRSELEVEDIEFLRQGDCSTAEASEYMGGKPSTQTFRRWAETNKIESFKNVSGNWRIKTVAIVRRVLVDAKTQEEI